MSLLFAILLAVQPGDTPYDITSCPCWPCLLEQYQAGIYEGMDESFDHNALYHWANWYNDYTPYLVLHLQADRYAWDVIEHPSKGHLVLVIWNPRLLNEVNTDG
jgi:hypothetical protein